MKKNLRGKILAIIAVLLIAIYGIIGVPSGVSGKALLEAITKRIHLGLDLKGGAHLILKVQVSDAVSAETDNLVGTIQQDLKKGHFPYRQVIKPDPTARPQQVRVDGVPPANQSAVRSLLDSKYGNEFDISGGTDNGFLLSMKPNIQTQLEKKTVSQAIETIRDRVDSLGVSEPVIQEYGLGANEILVELPGIDDLDRVKTIIQSTARLSIHAVIGGPFPDEQAALASVNGTLQPDQMLMHGSGNMATGSDSDAVYVLERTSVVAGNDFRSADPGTSQNTG